VTFGTRKFQFSFTQTQQEIQYATPSDPRTPPPIMNFH